MSVSSARPRFPSLIGRLLPGYWIRWVWRGSLACVQRPTTSEIPAWNFKRGLKQCVRARPNFIPARASNVGPTGPTSGHHATIASLALTRATAHVCSHNKSRTSSRRHASSDMARRTRRPAAIVFASDSTRARQIAISPRIKAGILSAPIRMHPVLRANAIALEVNSLFVTTIHRWHWRWTIPAYTSCTAPLPTEP